MGRVLDGEGRIVEESYFDGAGRLAPALNGIAKLTYNYEEQGAPRVAAFDERGHQVQTAILILEVLPGSQAARNNLLPGDTIVSYDGQRLDPATFAAATLAPGKAERELVVLREDQVLRFVVSRGRVGLQMEPVALPPEAEAIVRASSDE